MLKHISFTLPRNSDLFVGLMQTNTPFPPTNNWLFLVGGKEHNQNLLPGQKIQIIIGPCANQQW